MEKSQNFKEKDDILEIKVPDGAESVEVNNLDTKPPPNGVRWVKWKNGIAGKVSGIQWK